MHIIATGLDIGLAAGRIGDFGAGIELVVETGLDPGRVANLKRV